MIPCDLAGVPSVACKPYKWECVFETAAMLCEMRADAGSDANSLLGGWGSADAWNSRLPGCLTSSHD